MHFDIIGIDAIPDDVIELFSQAANSGDDWNNAKWSDAKARLKAALLDCQNGQCAYCRRPIRDEVGHVEIDHILPKESFGPALRWISNEREFRKSTRGYPNFRFEVKNLILTCKRCNNKKGTFDCRKDRSTPANIHYTTDHKYYEWVHPHFHSYSDHVEILNDLIYNAKGGSVNGECVISICKLDEIASVEIAASDARIKGADNFAKALGLLLHMVDDFGWDFVIKTVYNQFPETPIDIVNATAETYKSAWNTAFP